MLRYNKPFMDETLYSILARQNLTSGCTSASEFLKTVSMNKNVQLDSMLPAYIPLLSSTTGLTKENLLKNHCLLDYYRSFSNPEKFSQSKALLLQGKSTDVHAILSIISNRVNEFQRLNYCPSCIQECYKKYSTGYWQRKHQLPGVSACLTHKILLSSISRNRKYLQLPPFNTDAIECSAKETLLAELSYHLIINEIPEYFDKQRLLQCYKHRLRDLGFANKNLRIYQSSLRSEILKFWYHLNSQKAVSSIFSNDISLPFPSSILYGRGNHHPLKHLLLIGFLFNDFNKFLFHYNNLGDESESHIIQYKTITKSKTVLPEDKEALSLLRQGCSLRKTAALVHRSIGHIKTLAISNKITISARPKQIFNNEIRVIWRKLFIGYSTSTIAKKFSISIASVEQILASHPYLIPLRRKIRYFKIRNFHREHMETYLHEHPFTTRNEVRQKINADYLWLFKNDKTWLYTVLPIPVRVNQKHTEISIH